MPRRSNMLPTGPPRASSTNKPEMPSTASWPEITLSIPKRRMRLTIWTPSPSSKWSAKSPDAMDGFLGAVGLVTLALGAMGVVNIMLVSVAERTREIGLRKALGATRRNILFQFFLEGLMLTAISGGIGVAGAYAVTRLLGLAPPIDGFELPHIYPASAALAMGTLAAAGIIAGLYPARRAALLTPVEALRQE